MLKLGLTLKSFLLKIVRCIYYEVKKLHKIDDPDYYEYDKNEDNDEINRIYLSENNDINYCTVNKEKWNHRS